MSPSLLRTVCVALLPLTLAACGSASRVADADMMVVGSIDGARPVAVENAFVRIPPGAGSIEQVREQTYANGVSQQIVLGGGQGSDNRMDVSIETEMPRHAVGSRLAMQKPSAEGIRLELAERFPGIQMHIVSRPMRNAYGPFGLAIGLGTGGARCVYAWQWIDDAGDLRGARGGLFKKLGVAAGGGTPASLRLRTCRQGVTADQLAGAMSQIVISRNAKAIANEGQAEGQPARSLDSEIAPVGPVAVVAPAVAAKPKARPARRAPSVTVGTPKPVRYQPPQPAYTPDEAGPRYLAPVAPARPAARSPAESYAAPAVPAPHAPRIPAPQAQPPAAPQVRTIPLPTRVTLDRSLPAAAYRGPSTAKAE